jgi:hypothetical protein
MKQLRQFLKENKDEILNLTEQKTLDLAGDLASSDMLKQGLPMFFEQLSGILQLERPATARPKSGK